MRQGVRWLALLWGMNSEATGAAERAEDSQSGRRADCLEGEKLVGCLLLWAFVTCRLELYSSSV